MKNFILLILLILVASSCKDRTTGMPRHSVIPRETFVEVLVDIHKMDAITNSPEFYNKFGAGDTVDVYSYIFERHGITKALFDSTVAAYSRIPQKYQKVYDDVILKLNLELDKIREDQPKFENQEEAR